MSELPVEIIFAILEQVYYRYRGNRGPFLWISREPDYQTLSACSLISSSWRRPAQNLLFNHITADAASCLVYTISYFSACRQKNILDELLKHTRILDISLSQDISKPSRGNQNQCYPDDFVALMKQCTNLYELNLSVSGIFSLRSIITELQDTTRPSRLRALRIGRCSVQSPILYELLEFFPTIQFLTTEMEVAAPPPPSDRPSKVQLYELAMFRTLPTEICEWILSSSRESLRVLEMRDLPSARVSRILEGYGPGLESFRTMKFNLNTAKLVKSCTSLRELVLLGLPSVPPLRANDLPMTLEHLSLVHHHSDPSMDISDVMMAVKTLPKLRLLTSDAKFGMDPFYEVFQEICIKRGIRVDISTYGNWPNDEPVKTVSFPRGRSTFNFRVMNWD